MADVRNPETERKLGEVEVEAATSDTLSTTSRDSPSPHLQALEKTQSRAGRRSSVASHATDDTEPLSPVEAALSRGSHIDDDEYDRAAISHVRTTTSIGSSASRPPDYEVVFEDDDPENPRNWPSWYRAWVIFCISFASWVVVFYSTSYTASIPGLKEEYDLQSTTVATLGVTSYLLGLAVGSLLMAPASELYGRRPVYVVCMIIFTLLIIPCCLSTSLDEMIVVRFFG